MKSRPKRSPCIGDSALYTAVKPSLSEAVMRFFFENGTKECMVYGHSMDPFLTYGENVTIVPNGAGLKKAHCYAFISGNTLSIHRFIRCHDQHTALFAGDNCLLMDLVPLPNVVGELSACQNQWILFIIRWINSLFSTAMMLFPDVLALHRIRRFIIRSLHNSMEKRTMP